MADNNQSKEKKQPTEAEISAQAENIYRQINELLEKIKEVSPQNPRRTTTISEKEIGDINEKIGNILKNLTNFSNNFLQEKLDDRNKINGYITKIDQTKTDLDSRLGNNSVHTGANRYDSIFNATFDSRINTNVTTFSKTIGKITSVLKGNMLLGEFERMQDDFKKEAERKQKEEEEKEQERQHNEQLQKSVNEAVKQRNNVAKEMRKQIKQAQQPEPQPAEAKVEGQSAGLEQPAAVQPTVGAEAAQQQEQQVNAATNSQQEKPAAQPATEQQASVDTHADDVAQKKEQTKEEKKQKEEAEKRQKEEEEKKEQEKAEPKKPQDEVVPEKPAAPEQTDVLTSTAPAQPEAKEQPAKAKVEEQQQKEQQIDKSHQEEMENDITYRMEKYSQKNKPEVEYQNYNTNTMPTAEQKEPYAPEQVVNTAKLTEEQRNQEIEDHQGDMEAAAFDEREEENNRMIEEKRKEQEEAAKKQKEEEERRKQGEELGEFINNLLKEAPTSQSAQTANTNDVQTVLQEKIQELPKMNSADDVEKFFATTVEPNSSSIPQPQEQSSIDEFFEETQVKKAEQGGINLEKTSYEDEDLLKMLDNNAPEQPEPQPAEAKVEGQSAGLEQPAPANPQPGPQTAPVEVKKPEQQPEQQPKEQTEPEEKKQEEEKEQKLQIPSREEVVVTSDPQTEPAAPQAQPAAGAEQSAGAEQQPEKPATGTNQPEQVVVEQQQPAEKPQPQAENITDTLQQAEEKRKEREKKEQERREYVEKINSIKFDKFETSKNNEARKTAQNVEKVYVEELVSRLKNNQWSKMIVKSDNGTETSLSKDINTLSPDYQKHLLTEALKRIYNSNDENVKKLQQELGLDKDNNLGEKVIDNLIGKTIEQNFDKYQKELFAEKEPKKEDKTINITSIIDDIRKTVSDIIKQPIQQQTSQPAQEQTINGFGKALIKREKDILNLIEKDGVKKFREEYRTNSIEDPAKHELDVLVLKKFKTNYNKDDNELYKKIAPVILRHGVYKQIKNDQEKFDKINKLTKDHGILNREIKPKKIKADKIGDIINEFPNTEAAEEALKFLCKQQFKNENCSKEKNKWPDNMLNAVLENMRPDAFQNIAMLENAINEKNMASTDKPLSFTKPTEDDTLYFKIIYSHSSEGVMDELKQDLEKEENSYFRKQFGRLSLEKQEDLINFIKIVGEKKEGITENEKDVNNKILGTLISLNEDKKIKKKTQEGQSPKGPLSEDKILEAAEKLSLGGRLGLSAKKVEGDPKSKASNPYFLVNEKGRLYKNEENILDKQTFSLQDSFLGLVCAKNKALALTSLGKSKNMLDGKYGKKLDKDERLTREQIKEQQKATKAAKEAIQRAGGDLKTVQKHTMPLLKNSEITLFTEDGTPLLLSDAVKVCLKALELKQKKEQALGIVKNKLGKEKSLVDQVCDMLQPTDESEQYFTKEQLEEIKKAVSMQLIATNTFVEKFQEQNKALAEKLEKEQEMAAELKRKKEEIEQSIAETQKQPQMDGQPIEVANGLSQKMQEQPQQRITVNTSIENFRKAEQLQTQEQIEKKEVLTREATPVLEQKPEQLQQDSTPAPKEVPEKPSAEVDSPDTTPTSKESSTKLEAETQPKNMQQQNDTSVNSEQLKAAYSSLGKLEESKSVSQNGPMSAGSNIPTGNSTAPKGVQISFGGK